MTRPSNIYLLPIYLVFWILRFIFDNKEKKEIKEVIYGFVSCIACGVILLGYCGLMKIQHGSFSITSVSYINNLVTCINSDSYKYGQNQEIIDYIGEIKGDRKDGDICWIVFRELEKKYDENELKQFANSSLKNDNNYKKFLLDKTITLGMANIGTAGYVTNKIDYAKINYTEIRKSNITNKFCTGIFNSYDINNILIVEIY